jgi:hypothetical protein
LSVIKSKRGQSGVQFLDTALDLETFTIKACTNFAKRYTFVLTNEISDLSKAIFNNVKMANSIYPLCKSEAQLRRNYFLSAYGTCQCIITQIQVAYDLKVINSTKYEKFEREIKTMYLDLPPEEREKRILQKRKNLDKKRDSLVEEWMTLADKEMSLIKAILVSDKERFKDLPKYIH